MHKNTRIIRNIYWRYLRKRPSPKITHYYLFKNKMSANYIYNISINIFIIFAYL